MDIVLYCTSSPAECCVALCTPHLIAAVDFKDTSGALGAWLGVIRK
jgi:hypothetical protein